MSRLIYIAFVLWCFVVLTTNQGCNSQSCEKDADCPSGAFCRQVSLAGQAPKSLCILEVPRSGIGDRCEDHDNCISRFCLQPPGNTQKYCSETCKVDRDCMSGMYCELFGGSLQICMWIDKPPPVVGKGCECGREGASCRTHGHSDCDLANGYFCLSSKPNDPAAVCVLKCDPNSPSGEKGACDTGYTCSPTTTGLHICTRSPFKQGNLGSNCSQGGRAQCPEDAFCFSRWQNDDRAFCSKYCNPYQPNDCGSDFVCETPNRESPWLCIHKGPSPIGADCSQNDFFECRTGLCIRPSHNSNERYCSQPCNIINQDCPIGYRCELVGTVYRYLCVKSEAGKLGDTCNKYGEAECQSGICILPKEGTINRICSQKCDASNTCPQEYLCEEQRQLCIPISGNKGIGESCSRPDECLMGTCISDGQGKQFCTQPCFEHAQCPSDYACLEHNFHQKFCLPQPHGNRQLGELCPNGPRDCASGYCLTDPLKNRSFCTAECNRDDPNSCPKPYICTKVSERSAFCTPNDFVFP